MRRLGEEMVPRPTHQSTRKLRSFTRHRYSPMLLDSYIGQPPYSQHREALCGIPQAALRGLSLASCVIRTISFLNLLTRSVRIFEGGMLLCCSCERHLRLFLPSHKFAKFRENGTNLSIKPRAYLDSESLLRLVILDLW